MKLMGCNEDSSTEQQRKQTVTTIILIRRIYKIKGTHRANLCHHPMPSALPSNNELPSGQLPHSKPSMTPHDT